MAHAHLDAYPREPFEDGVISPLLSKSLIQFIWVLNSISMKEKYWSPDKQRATAAAIRAAPSNGYSRKISFTLPVSM
jgi:hypothetical protein